MASPLPPAVLQPITCPPSKCRRPGEPLPPEVAVKINARLGKSAVAELRRSQTINAARLIAWSTFKGVGGESGFVGRAIISEIEEGATPQQVLDAAKGPEGRRRMTALLEPEFGKAKSCEVALVEFLPLLYPPSMRGPACLHDFFDALGIHSSEADRTAATDFDQETATYIASFFRDYDSLSLGEWTGIDDHTARQIDTRPAYKGKWRKVIKEAAREYAKLVEAITIE